MASDVRAIRNYQQIGGCYNGHSPPHGLVIEITIVYVAANWPGLQVWTFSF